MLLVNAKVNTPLGVQGIVQGAYRLNDADGNVIVDGVMVRVPINEITRPEMNKSSCLTPRANFSGLWVFAESELK